MIRYHDKEWGVPCHDDKKLFEYIVLDTFQAGLSWRTVLYKRENFRKAFANFDARRIAKFEVRDVTRLMKDTGIIRNRQKILATIKNAEVFFEVQKEFSSFDAYIWSFVKGKTITNRRKKQSHLRANSRESDAMSKDLKKWGFKFVGSTICYAFMQATGMVNDHEKGCFLYKNK